MLISQGDNCPSDIGARLTSQGAASTILPWPSSSSSLSRMGTPSATTWSAAGTNAAADRAVVAPGRRYAQPDSVLQRGPTRGHGARQDPRRQAQPLPVRRHDRTRLNARVADPSVAHAYRRSYPYGSQNDNTNRWLKQVRLHAPRASRAQSSCARDSSMQLGYPRGWGWDVDSKDADGASVSAQKTVYNKAIADGKPHISLNQCASRTRCVPDQAARHTRRPSPSRCRVRVVGRRASLTGRPHEEAQGQGRQDGHCRPVLRRLALPLVRLRGDFSRTHSRSNTGKLGVRDATWTC